MQISHAVYVSVGDAYRSRRSKGAVDGGLEVDERINDAALEARFTGLVGKSLAGNNGVRPRVLGLCRRIDPVRVSPRCVGVGSWHLGGGDGTPSSSWSPPFPVPADRSVE